MSEQPKSVTTKQVVGPFATDFLALSQEIFGEDIKGSLNDADARVVAIVCAAYIEKYLVDLIAKQMPGLTPSLKNTIFNETNGMAGSFSARLHLALALDVITPLVYDDAKLIGRIRNQFAHHVTVKTFDDPKVRGLINNLQISRDIHYGEGGSTSNREELAPGVHFCEAALRICATILNCHIGSEMFPSPDKSDEPLHPEG